jgi:phage terminase large subunit-like protein
VVDCRPIRDGNAWILAFLMKAKMETVVLDGKGGQDELKQAMKQVGLKEPACPTSWEFINANAVFTQAVADAQIVHMNQPSLTQAASNCERRNIGNNGGFGYRSLKDEIDIALLDSVILATWACSKYKPKTKQSISY